MNRDESGRPDPVFGAFADPKLAFRHPSGRVGTDGEADCPDIPIPMRDQIGESGAEG